MPSHNDHHLFELLTLEGVQAGLSWATILRKRDGYRAAFAQFDPDRVARFDRRKIERLLRDSRIVRNRLKVESTVNNARRVLEARQELGSFDTYVWQFVGGAPIVGRRRKLQSACLAAPAPVDEHEDTFAVELAGTRPPRRATPPRRQAIRANALPCRPAPSSCRLPGCRDNSRDNKRLATCVQIPVGPEENPCKCRNREFRSNARKVEGLVACIGRGGSSPLGRIFS